MPLSIYENFNTNKKTLQRMFETSSNGSIYINRCTPLLFQNIKDANAILLKIKTGLFSSRLLSNEEHTEVVGDLLKLGFKDLTYSKCTNGTFIVDTLNDSNGCLVDLYEQIKLLPKKFKITLGISNIDRDRVVVVKEKFWESEEKRPKGYHFIDDLT